MTDLTLHRPQEAGLNAVALDSLSHAIQRRIDDGQNFGAAVIVARGGKIGYKQTFGTASGLRASRVDDIYLTMSVAKSFTAAIALRFVDKGLLSLTTRVADVIDGFGILGKDKITLWHLLNHTGGVYPHIAPPAPFGMDSIYDLDKAVAMLTAQPLVYETGSRCAYTQLGSHDLTAKMVELTDPEGRKFAQIAHEELFAPLGMHDTSFGLANADEPRFVPVSFTDKMTTPASAGTATILNGMINGVVPAGGAFTTVEDLFKFAECLRLRGKGGDNGDYRLLSPALLDYAVQNSTGDMPNHAWDFSHEFKGALPFPANFHLLGGCARGEGFYWNVCGATASHRAFSALGGGSTAWLVDPERDLTVVFLSSGFIEGLEHLSRVMQINELALSSCE